MKNAILVLVLISSVAAAADSSLWGQMETGKLEPLNGRVVKIQDAGDASTVELEIKTENGERKIQTLAICNPGQQSQTETERAVFMSRQLELLRQAQKADDRIQGSVKGPWQPCLQAVEIAPAVDQRKKL